MDNNNLQGQNYQSSSNYSSFENVVIADAEVTAKESKKKKTKKFLFKLIVIILLIIALGVGGFFGYKHFFSKTDKKSEETDATNTSGNIPEDAIPEEYTSFELYPDRVVSKSDIKEFAESLEERIQVLGDKYEIQYNDEKITVKIEKNMLGETPAERMSTIEILSSRGNIGLGYNNYSWESRSFYSPEKSDINDVSVKEFDKEELLDDYILNISDERFKQLDSIEADTLYGVELTFDSNGEDKIAECVESEADSEKIHFYHDFLEDIYEGEKFLGIVLIPDEDDLSTVYVISLGSSYDKNAELMKKVLEQDELDFCMSMISIDEPNWETDGKRMGDNQVDSMDGFTVVAEFSPDEYSRYYNSETDYAEYESIIKERMDCLNIDYMFGTTGIDDKTYCIRLNPEEFAPDFYRLIFGETNIDIRSAFDEIYSFYSAAELTEKDGKPALMMSTYSSSDELLTEYNIPGDMVYLVVNDVTIASADITSMECNDGESEYCLYFTDFECFGDIDVSDEEENVLNLISSIYDIGNCYFEGTFRFRTYGSNGKETNESLGDIDWKYDPLTSRDKEVFEIITSLGCDVEKTVNKRNALEILLDVPVNDELPVAFLEKVKEIYSACDFDSGAYNEIFFIIKDEKNDTPADEYRVSVYKDTFDGKMYVRMSANGPKFGEYWLETYELMEEDPFYVALDW